MSGVFLRGLLLFAAASLSMLTAANGNAIAPFGVHREAVDEQSYPWSAIGKLFTEGGGECSGVLISRDKVLTAAHCLFNHRTQRFIPTNALHFLVGYRSGRYSAHARIVSYDIGAGFDPLRYDETSNADWAVMTVATSLPAEIEPLRLHRELAPSGTKVVIAGYPQDRAHAMTADRDCELREKIDSGRLFLHTCRGMKGYSGAPILLSAGGAEMEIAGIQIASIQKDGTEKMIAVPAQAIWRQERDENRELPVLVEASAGETSAVCHTSESSEDAMSLATIHARLDIDDLDIVSSISGKPAFDVTAWLASEPFAFVIP